MLVKLTPNVRGICTRKREMEKLRKDGNRGTNRKMFCESVD